MRHPCYFGIDIPREEELIAAGRSVQEIADYIGVDSLGYLSLEGLGKALRVVKDDTNLDDAAAIASLHAECCYGCMHTAGWPFDPTKPPLLMPVRNEKLLRVS